MWLPLFAPPLALQHRGERVKFFEPEPLNARKNGGWYRGLHPTQLRCNPNLGILKYGRERSAAAVRERIRPALAIVRDEAPDSHGLHCMIDDANRAVVNAGRDAEQNHAVLCAEFCRRLFHDLLPPSVLRRRGVILGFARAYFRRLLERRMDAVVLNRLAWPHVAKSASRSQTCA
jgi:hypothetical protein